MSHCMISLYVYFYLNNFRCEMKSPCSSIFYTTTTMIIMSKKYMHVSERERKTIFIKWVSERDSNKARIYAKESVMSVALLIQFNPWDPTLIHLNNNDYMLRLNILFCQIVMEEGQMWLLHIHKIFSYFLFYFFSLFFVHKEGRDLIDKRACTTLFFTVTHRYTTLNVPVLSHITLLCFFPTIYNFH